MEAVRGSGQSGFIKEFRLATSPDRRHLTVAPVQPYVRGNHRLAASLCWFSGKPTVCFTAAWFQRQL